jgi:hypothetical protein
MADGRGKTAGSRRTQFRPGQANNPRGRTPGVAAAIKQLVGESGEKLWQAWSVVAFGDDAAAEKVLGKRVKIGIGDKMKALAELRDSGFGRPMQTMQTDAGAIAVPESVSFVIRKAEGAENKT